MNEELLISNLIPAMWVVWASYWAVSARTAKLTLRRESRASRMLNVMLLVIGILLVAVPHVPSPLFATRILPASLATYFTGVTLVFIGLAFAVWARRHLGTNWSGTVTVKQDHELVRTGPYRIVRHPIYTGLLTAILGSAVARGELRGIWAILLCTAAFQIRVRLEERWMQQEFGAEYARYRAEVPALIPFWPC
jgi:protein-S-isoprenylcysteine O-methyltransferase Ste14